MTFTFTDTAFVGGQFSPQSIPWHSLHMADSLALANGAAVTSWPNLGSDGGALTPLSGTPATYRASTAAFAGRPTVELSGTGVIRRTFTTIAQTFTLVAVAQRLGGGVASYFIGGDAAPSSAIYKPATLSVVAGHSGADGPTRTLDTAVHLWEYTAAGNSSRLAQDDASATGNASTNGIDCLALGGRGDALAATLLTGHLALAGLIARALTADERTALHAWAQTRYGTP